MHQYTSTEDAAIVRLYEGGGLIWKQIADEIGLVGHPNSVRARYLRIQARGGLDAMQYAMRPAAKIRECMNCRRVIRSQHHGHRMCGHCRNISASPFEPDGICGVAQ